MEKKSIKSKEDRERNRQNVILKTERKQEMRDGEQDIESRDTQKRRLEERTQGTKEKRQSTQAKTSDNTQIDQTHTHAGPQLFRQ